MIQHHCFLYFVILCLGTLGFSQTPAESYQAGQICFGQKDYVNAIRHFEKAMLTPEYEILAGIYTAKSYAELQKYGEVISICSRILEQSPKQIDLLYERGKAYKAILQSQRARADFEELRLLYPNNIFVRYHLGDCYAQLKLNDLAILEFQKVISFCPDFALGHLGLGMVYLAEEKLDLAQQHLDLALQFQPDLALAHHQLGKLLLKSFKFPEAIEHFQVMLLQDSQNPEAWHLLGKALQQQKEWQKALAAYTKALQYTPEAQHLPILSDKALLLYESKQWELALADINVLLKHYGETNARLYYQRGLVLMELKQTKAALEDLKKAIDIEPNFVDGQLALANIYSQEGPYHSAKLICDKLITRGQVSAPAYLYRARALFQLKAYKDAVEDFTASIQLQAALTEAYLGRAEAYLKIAEQSLVQIDQWYEKALYDLSKAIAWEPQTASHYNKRGRIYYFLKQYERATQDFDEAIRLQPETADFYYYRGNVKQTLKCWRDAIDDFTLAIEKNPQHLNAYVARARTHFQVKDYDNSLADYTKAIALNPQEPKLYFLRSKIFWEMKNPQKALQDLQQAIALKPGDEIGIYYHFQGKILAEIGEYEKALTEITKAIELQPDYKEFYELRSMIYRKLNRVKEAEEDLKTAQNLEPLH